jgi:hypothetical protein
LNLGSHGGRIRAGLREGCRQVRAQRSASCSEALATAWVAKAECKAEQKAVAWPDSDNGRYHPESHREATPFLVQQGEVPSRRTTACNGVPRVVGAGPAGRP